MRHFIQQSFSVKYRYPVYFTANVFSPENTVLRDMAAHDDGSGRRKMLFIIDDGVSNHHRNLIQQIKSYAGIHEHVMELCGEPLIIPGGESCKNDMQLFEMIIEAVNRYGIDRHSYVTGVGGGAVLDLVGFAASITHRGIRHIRIPTTVLSQNDSGVGVKNGINYFNKKNFLGTFTPPFAVINDHTFLTTLDDRDWRSGIAEAIKVSLIKDADFFRYIQSNARKLCERDMTVMQDLIYRCAKLHLEHISGGDPFEMGSSRPLDFGHWASHKLEGLTNYDIRHGEAVAIGICLDSIYSSLSGFLSKSEMDEIISVIKEIGFHLYLPELSQNLDKPDHPGSLLSGLNEFREHLGGKLTVMLLKKIGEGVEVNEMDFGLIKKSIALLKTLHSEKMRA
ncbi:MAG TPA: 3-dehydroquinate synthase [Chitinophagales bacterium]|nr:3-dehydroquinate synthase [Chitinophagales bacterium]